MRLFGQFLIDEGLISKEDFVAGMIIQAEALPSLPFAIHELKLFDLDVQVSIFAYQANHFKEYRAACVEMGIWDEANVEHPLGRFFLSRLKPLGKILVEQGLLTLEQLSSALEKYVALSDQLEAEDDKKPAPNLTLVQKNAQSFADIKVRKHNPPAPSSAEKRLYDLYCQSFNEAMVDRLRGYLDDPSSAIRGRLIQELHAARHAASFILAFKSAELLSRLIAVCEDDKPFSASEKALINQGINLAWVLREGLREGHPELLTLGSNALDSRIDELGFILSKLSERP